MHSSTPVPGSASGRSSDDEAEQHAQHERIEDTSMSSTISSLSSMHFESMTSSVRSSTSTRVVAPDSANAVNLMLPPPLEYQPRSLPKVSLAQLMAEVQKANAEKDKAAESK